MSLLSVTTSRSTATPRSEAASTPAMAQSSDTAPRADEEDRQNGLAEDAQEDRRPGAFDEDAHKESSPLPPGEG